MVLCIIQGYPKESWIVTEDRAPPNQIRETFMAYGNPIYKGLCRSVRLILDSKDYNTILAVSANIQVLAEKIKKEEDTEELERHIRKLEAEIKQGKILSMKKSGKG